MKIQTLCLFLLVQTVCVAQRSLQKIWETGTTLARPECVLIDGDVLYVSLKYGEPLVADGIGAVAKIGTAGNIIDTAWATGMDAPKGMGLWKGKLYVTDITKVVVINTANGKIEFTIPIEGAKGLNDIEFDRNGVMYVSDPEVGNVYRVVNNRPELYLSNLKAANGLKVIRGSLYILTDSALLKVLPGKKLATVTAMESGGDGVQLVGNGDFLLTRHHGVIHYLPKAGPLQTLLDTRAEGKRTGDIDYDPKQRIIYVPTLTTNSVVAYRLKP